jgi:hypothetical protein
VVVNGAPVIDNNQMTAARPGVALRGSGHIETSDSVHVLDRITGLAGLR